MSTLCFKISMFSCHLQCHNYTATILRRLLTTSFIYTYNAIITLLQRYTSCFHIFLSRIMATFILLRCYVGHYEFSLRFISSDVHDCLRFILLACSIAWPTTLRGKLNLSSLLARRSAPRIRRFIAS